MPKPRTWPASARTENRWTAEWRTDVIADLDAAGVEVDKMVADLDLDEWTRPTPAPGWTIAHQIAHLAAGFRMVWLTVTDPAAFQPLADRLNDDFDAAVRGGLAGYLAEPGDVLLIHWRDEFETAVNALATVHPEQTVPWLDRPLRPGTLAAIGMMELFAHGQDIADTLHVEREHTDRIKRVTDLTTRTWEFGYRARALTVPAAAFRFSLTAPSGARWEYGEPDAPNVITGSAVEFCLLVTRRRHHADLGLTAAGPDTAQWLEIAQAYRGPAGPGRPQSQFRALR